MYLQRACGQTAILNLQCSVSGPRCQNYNSQAAPGQSSSRVLAAGRARGVARTPNMTAVLQQGVLWQPRIRVRHVSRESTECSANVSLLHEDGLLENVSKIYVKLCEESKKSTYNFLRKHLVSA